MSETQRTGLVIHQGGRSYGVITEVKDFGVTMIRIEPIEGLSYSSGLCPDVPVNINPELIRFVYEMTPDEIRQDIGRMDDVHKKHDEQYRKILSDIACANLIGGIN